ncbi:cell division protein SepF [Latilactobacillus graminis]|uniref:Cell division protein SepF n=2 Tax=Latilactobacillus graminis TaxID=60519 RepID=A0AA89I911_9LACO|nr:cell division protein SepF [Latilactobacillus graminis]KRM24037.1 cell division protein sepF [Latilactobacillus graminis DSM 20719]QFP79800.1 DUF552 domain-containing protein [Latilactobacillus graminis]
MAGKFSLSSFFGMTDEDEYANTQETAAVTNDGETSVRPSNVVSMQAAGANKMNKIVLCEPRIYSDAKKVGKSLLENKAVIVNFTRIEATQATRIVDFLTGTVFAINGEIQRVGDQIFLCTPPNYEIDGNLSDIVDQNDFDIEVN